MTIAPSRPATDTAAETLQPLVDALLPRGLPLAIRCWDGSAIGPESPAATIVVNSPDAIRRLMWAPNELGFGRAYVAGEIDVEGDLFGALAARENLAEDDNGATLGLGAGGWQRAAAAAIRLGVLGPPPPAPAEESRLRGRRHSPQRDRAAISYHYDISNDFYRMLLGPSLTYSCAYFTREDSTLEEAQAAKYDLICRKLGLEPGMRLLDVGCGWGGMVMHAVRHYGVEAVGVTISDRQAELATERVADAELSDRVQIRLRDYREIHDGPYDAISSIGMFEHVGMPRLAEYFERLYSLLRPTGRLLNHAISRPSGRSRFARHSFVERYVFPDGELHEVGSVVSAMQQQRFEVRDVESLREHYAFTLRAWLRNLEADWDTAQRLVGPARARVWRLYIGAAALNFEAGRSSIHQVLGVKPDADGHSGMRRTRAEMLSDRDATVPR